ncbi:MAG: YdcF family protein [Alphaproteobacteria bacterium]|nr:YdcF family protein [Alphaproteobacteria bacterium]
MIISTAAKTLFRPSSLLILTVFISALVFMRSVPECREVKSKNIVVVTGDRNRIPRAVEMARKNPGSRVLISGAGSQDLRLPKDIKVEIESDSGTTFENSLAIRDWVLKNGFHDIAIITSDYHMWRTLLLTRRQLPFTEIETCAVPSPNFTRRQRIELWITEFGKYISTLIGVPTK